jgi:hypothetical protein
MFAKQNFKKMLYLQKKLSKKWAIKVFGKNYFSAHYFCLQYIEYEPGLPDFSLYNKPKWEKYTKMPTKY